jgi:uncharacterized protein with HEPN domain
MPPREWKLRVTDILEAVAKIKDYTADMDADVFGSDPKTIDAVIRNFTIIGEAATHVPTQITEAYPQIPWRKMRDMRNVAVHTYFGVKKHIIWDAIQDDLPPLVPLLEELLSDHS